MADATGENSVYCQSDSANVPRRAAEQATAMADHFQPQKFSVQTVLDGRADVKCPICGHDEFLPNVPVDLDRAQREGFRNVVVGIYGSDGLAALPVNFRHCANCGYVLNFVIGRFPEGEKK